MKKTLLIGLLGLLTAGSLQAQRVTDKLNRGLVAIPQGDKDGQDERYGTTGSGIFVTWRILPSEYYDTQYNLYRGTTKVNSTPLSVSNYQDNDGKKTDTYSVVPVINGVERKDLQSEAVTPWEHQYKDIPVANVYNRNGVDVTSGYSLNDCAVADVDGDGEMEFVVKRRNDSGNLRTEGNTTDFNRHECYKQDGTLLWYIDMGPNLMAGPDEQFDLILTDIHMAPVDGMQVFRVARAERPDTPVVFLTAYGAISTAIEAMKGGAFDYLTKPFKVDELLLTIRRALKLQKSLFNVLFKHIVRQKPNDKIKSQWFD